MSTAVKLRLLTKKNPTNTYSYTPNASKMNVQEWTKKMYTKQHVEKCWSAIKMYEQFDETTTISKFEHTFTQIRSIVRSNNKLQLKIPIKTMRIVALFLFIF